MGIPMIVTKAFRPGGSGSPELQPGARFTAPGQSLARTYRAMGWAEDAPPPEPEPQPEPPKRTYTRRDMMAEAPKAEPKAEEADSDKPKRRYTRRNLTAE